METAFKIFSILFIAWLYYDFYRFAKKFKTNPVDEIKGSPESILFFGPKKRRVCEITASLIREVISLDNQTNHWLDKAAYDSLEFHRRFPDCEESKEWIRCEQNGIDERQKHYSEKHWRMNVRLSIKQTK